MTMKLQAEYQNIVENLYLTDDDLYKYTLNCLLTNKYKKPIVGIAHDLKYAVMTPSEVCEWYDKYNCNDDHITTLFKNVIKNEFPKTWKLLQQNQ